MEEKGKEGADYTEFIHLSRPLSKKHPAMSRQDRAAQFAPFAALSGYEEAILKTAKENEEWVYQRDHSYGEKDWD